MNPKASSTNIEQPSKTTSTNTDKPNNDKNRSSDLNQTATTNTTITPSTSHAIHSNNQSASRPLACGRRRRHTISNNHIEFMFYHCLRDDIDEDDEDEHDEDDEEDSESSYHRISPRRQEQTLFDNHHCDVIVLKTDNGWCFDQRGKKNRKLSLPSPIATKKYAFYSTHDLFQKRKREKEFFFIRKFTSIVSTWLWVQDIFLPAWRRDAYEAAGQEDGFTGQQELVKVDEIRVD
ncbi:hypothetical protein PGTUg99_027719 [Puccinia graminis f. sp. tritici]|uniref:Uncharacterized protein n=1 Tax=Puccinia graminis f. sp. tritici TaxID=56615 RepID=A0A5B0RZ10_PUCGR|nr:hypothetical protein PGTUg99_027719 [Puccinia graminis f. sp. tritici]